MEFGNKKAALSVGFLPRATTKGKRAKEAMTALKSAPSFAGIMLSQPTALFPVGNHTSLRLKQPALSPEVSTGYWSNKENITLSGPSSTLTAKRVNAFKTAWQNFPFSQLSGMKKDAIKSAANPDNQSCPEKEIQESGIKSISNAVVRNETHPANQTNSATKIDQSIPLKNSRQSGFPDSNIPNPKGNILPALSERNNPVMETVTSKPIETNPKPQSSTGSVGIISPLPLNSINNNNSFLESTIQRTPSGIPTFMEGDFAESQEARQANQFFPANIESSSPARSLTLPPGEPSEFRLVQQENSYNAAIQSANEDTSEAQVDESEIPLPGREQSAGANRSDPSNPECSTNGGMASSGKGSMGRAGGGSNGSSGSWARFSAGMPFMLAKKPVNSTKRVNRDTSTEKTGKLEVVNPAKLKSKSTGVAAGMLKKTESILRNFERVSPASESKNTSLSEKVEWLTNLTQLAQKIRAQAQLLKGGGDSVLEVRLYPAHLGSVKVRIEVRGDQMNLSFSVERPEAATILRDARVDLAGIVTDQGYTLGQCEVESRLPQNRWAQSAMNSHQGGSADRENFAERDHSNQDGDPPAEEHRMLNFGYNTLDLVA